MQSATTDDSLGGVFCYKPFDVTVDWSMVAKASPCYVTVSFYFPVLLFYFLEYVLFFDDILLQYIKDAIDQIMKFFQSSTAVSQTLALEAAAAVQVSFTLFVVFHNLCQFVDK